MNNAIAAIAPDNNLLLIRRSYLISFCLTSPEELDALSFDILRISEEPVEPAGPKASLR
jgi:hypothetical protein